MKKWVKISLISSIVVVLAIAFYFTFFFYYSCDDLACFNSHLEKCSRTKFVNDAEDIAWGYSIEGKENGGCEVNVEIVKVKVGTLDKKVLEDKSMNCILPFGIVSAPESDLLKCHGRLKEELQDLLITKLHSYILESVGEITEELRGFGNGASPTIENSTEVVNASA